ncbi:EAL domain-containing protein [Geovibrio thiophilus]|uniref:EAL domain-containing protein n=1 Tax=Geovibrio thiophilus TaxID=139438 RepID=A0A410JWY7_9BACT|nr:EAL domain-containing protein [Geovibrio thiophilus]QAR32712.1 EAL domain-containing protein [Geovibrio thiophilus]
MTAYKYSASLLSLFASLSTAMVFSAVVMYFVNANAKNDYEERAALLEKRFVESSQAEVKSEVQRMLKRMDAVRESSVEMRKSAVALRVASAAEYVNLSLERRGSYKSADFGKTISAFKGADDSGRFFIVAEDGKIIYHEEDESFIGRNILELLKGSPELSDVLKELRDSGFGFGSYELQDNLVKSGKRRIGYVQRLKGVPLFIGSSFTVESAEEEAKKRVAASIRRERYGKDGVGYFWVNTNDFQAVVHPITPELEGKNLKNMRSRDGQYIFQEIDKILKNGGGYAEYFWPRPDTVVPERKVTYVTEYKPWGWVIGTGFYFSDLEKQLEEERRLIEKLVQNDLAEVKKVIVYLFLAVLAVGVFIYRMIRRLEIRQEGHRNLLEQYKSILDKSSVVTITDEFGVMTYVNDKFCEISGYSRDELLGNRHNIIKHPTTPIETFKDLWGTITKGRVWKGVLRNRRKDGESFYISATIAPILNRFGEVIEYIACANDITELVENRNRIEELFNSDSLTGLGSRVKLINDAEPIEYPVLAILDIRGFKQINEFFGNHFADRILMETAREFVAFPALSGYLVYRLHSDKFGILADNADILVFKENIAAAMRRVGAILQERHGEDKRIYFTAGIAADKDNLLAYADMALNGAKKLKQDILVYSQADNRIIADFEENLEIIRKVSDALKNDRVTAYYQPIIDLKTGDSEKYECLMRIIDENGDVISPAKFLDISKKTNMYPRLTARVIEKSVAAFKNLPYHFSINLSVEDIFDRDTMDYLFTVAKNNGVLGRLVIEIVESQELVNIDETNRIFEKFKSGGAKISIDDFGAGFSNFDYLMNIRADYLKIDASIVKRVEDDEASREIIASIVSLAKHSGMRTVAEFISNENIAREISLLGVDYGQGYFYGKPEEKPVFISQAIVI